MDISVLFGTNCYNTDIFQARDLRFCREVHIDDYDDNYTGNNDVDNNNNFVSTFSSTGDDVYFPSQL